MPTIRLYSQSMNPFTEKVACALALKGLDYERVHVDDAEEIARLNPERAELPVLEVDGERRWDSPALVAWLEELVPQPSLYAADPKLRGLQQNLAEWSDTSFAFYWNRWRAARDEAAQRDIERGLLSKLQSHLGRRGGEGQGSPSVRELEILSEVANRMDDLVGFLGERDFFYATQPSVADIAVYGMMLIMAHGPMPGSAAMLEARPTLAAHLRRMTALAGRRPLSDVDGAEGEPEVDQPPA